MRLGRDGAFEAIQWNMKRDAERRAKMTEEERQREDAEIAAAEAEAQAAGLRTRYPKKKAAKKTSAAPKKKKKAARPKAKRTKK